MQPSHYAREKLKDKQFLASNLSIAQLFRDFLSIKGLSQLDGNLPLSYNTFRKIFRGYKLSFKRPRVDTCGKCDSLAIIKRFSHDEDEITNADRIREVHLQQAEQHYESLHYDLVDLPRLKNRVHAIPWRKPPAWKKTDS